VWTKDDLLDNVMLYWLTETYLSAALYYYNPGRPGGMDSDFINDDLPIVPVPTGVMQFKGDVWNMPRKWAERLYNIQSWKVEDKGGHFAPAEKPDVLVEDLREFFRRFR
jgi:pimeloyl-ACP methyl ester carboxylesterase